MPRWCLAPLPSAHHLSPLLCELTVAPLDFMRVSMQVCPRLSPVLWRLYRTHFYSGCFPARVLVSPPIWLWLGSQIGSMALEQSGTALPGAELRLASLWKHPFLARRSWASMQSKAVLRCHWVGLQSPSPENRYSQRLHSERPTTPHGATL